MRGKRILRIGGSVLGVVALLGIGAFWYLSRLIQQDPFAPLYADNCAVCHGESFEGSALGPALVGAPLIHGDSVSEIAQSIRAGYPERGMPPWTGPLDDGQIRSLAILVAEQRVNRRFTDFKVDKTVELPTGPVPSELVSFRVAPVTGGIAAKPFSIAPLPDGRILLTEKVAGLSVVSPAGERSAPLAGTPATTGYGVDVLGLDYGLGWLLDVKPHPDFAHNGWIYLVHTDLCADCGEDGSELVPRTMSRIVRGHITAEGWRDEQVIWEVDDRFYSVTPDIAAGGRLTFDTAGYVYLSVGIKGNSNFRGVQDLSTPYGKVHRVHDDGRIPADNPFVGLAGAMPSIWTYGHRSPQGLEFDAVSGVLWESEMGPRGGDEVNILLPGHNYGWPLTSRGVDYDGTPVEYWKDLGIEFDLASIDQPVVDLTPSPAVSSFVVYHGAAFPEWEGDLIVGSLKATELYRFTVRDGVLVHSEILLEDLARVRDVEIDARGEILLLLEHEAQSQIVRLAPVRAATGPGSRGDV